MTSPTVITVSKLSRLVGTPAAPFVINFSADEDFDADPRLIPGSFRLSLDQVPLLTPEFRRSKLIAVCCDGKTLSQSAAALFDGICSVADGRAASEASHSFPDFATARYQRSVCESRAVESGGRVEGTSALLGLATCAFQRWRVTALCATPFLGVHHSCPRQRPPQSQQCKRERHHHANP